MSTAFDVSFKSPLRSFCHGKGTSLIPIQIMGAKNLKSKSFDADVHYLGLSCGSARSAQGYRQC